MHEVVGGSRSSRRVRVERGIYRQANGKYAVCFMLDGKPRFRTVGSDLELARAQRLSFMRAARFGSVAAPPGCGWRWSLVGGLSDTSAAWTAGSGGAGGRGCLTTLAVAARGTSGRR